jgi:RimJ/RimL family protein N-acetyltransferase
LRLSATSAVTAMTLPSWNSNASSGKNAEPSVMKMKTGKITFRPLQENDLLLMHRWLNTPHVSEWYNIFGKNNPSQDEVNKKYPPRIKGNEPVDCYTINYDNKPIGMIQSCKIDDFPDEKANFGIDRNCAGIDLFIGEENYVHRGLGSFIVRQFLRELVFQKYDVDCCIVDPEVNNEIALKAYYKAGFRYLKTIWYEKEGKQEHILIINRDEIIPRG